MFPSDSFVAPVCSEKVEFKNMGVLQYLQTEARREVDPKGERWALFRRDSPHRIGTGSLVRLVYRASRSAPSATSFTGVLLAIRRSTGDPTIIVRGIVDDVGVEQVFCIFSPLLEKIDVLKAAPTKTSKKLYGLREKPADILRLQRIAAEKQSSETASTKPSKKYRI